MRSIIYDWHFSFQNKTCSKNIRFTFLVIWFLQHIRKIRKIINSPDDSGVIKVRRQMCNAKYTVYYYYYYYYYLT